ncbi:MAG TPA: PEP-CTERM sorting domain-containing protein [Gemmataceae bacterium]|nr:PEP-CTERM sorting domain-containing protein [Gemmataceae bacterium]
MRQFGFLCVAVGLFLGLAQNAPAGVITFDNLSGNTGAIPKGYGGLNWDNFAYMSRTYLQLSGYNGYTNGAVSSPNVAFNAAGLPASVLSSNPFTLNSAYFTAAWRVGLTIAATDNKGDTKTFVVSPSGPMRETFNWTGITSVTFTPSGGYPAPKAAGDGTEFALDNLTVNAATVPEPGSLTLFGLGGLALAGYGWRRQKQTVTA